MLRKIILLCFLLSGFLLSQQYSNDKYEKYVGTKLGKYPLTVTGLKKAIAALDSGIVYIVYPGLWDTTGLGQIPNKVALHGYLFGKMTHTLSDSTYLLNKIVWQDSPGQEVRDGYEIGSKSYSPFNFVGRQESWWGILTAYNILDKFPRKIKHANSRVLTGDFIIEVDTTYEGLVPSLQSAQFINFFNTDSLANNKSDSYVRGVTTGLKYTQRYQPNRFWDIIGFNSYIDFKTAMDTLFTNGGTRLFNGYYYLESGTYFNSNMYTYYSDIPSTMASRLIGTNKSYHFYGSGNYPSWFAGTVNSGAGYNYSADTSSTDAYKIVLAGAHTLTAGLEVTFKALTTNDSSATLQINALTAKALTKASSGAVNTSLATGDILAGQIVKCVYDGAQFQVISRLAQ